MNYKGKKWVVRPQDPKTALQIAEALGTTSLVGQVLLNRGFGDIEDAAQFLNCQLADLIDPYVLHGMKEAVDRIILSLEKKEKILVYGDYDVDGVTATSLILLFLRDLGFSTHYYIPKRVEEGYGVNKESIQKFAEEGVGLIITVDCGISSVEEIAYANALGMNVIVTDHHEPPIKLPDAAALINPLLVGCTFPYKSLSGVGLAFYLIAGLRKGLREKGFFKEGEEPSLVDYLDLVAVGTIADIVPLTGINRILVRAGLEQINVNPRLGIKTLLEVCGIQPGHVDSSSVAYRLAPKINAAGRLSDAMRGVLLLTTDSREIAEREAGFLDVENEERQRIEGKIYAEAVEMIQSNGIEKDFRSIVLSSADWHPGVVGIVASRLMERYYRPTVLLCLDSGVYKGSARGIPNFHLYQGLARCRDLLLEFGGHKYAAGIKVVPENLEKFMERFESVVREMVPEDGFTQVMKLDAEASLDALGMEEVSRLQGLSPFGAGNPEPVILIKDVEILNPKVVGGDHLSFLARQNGVTIGAIAFRQAHELEHLKEKMELAAVPEVQVWRGISQVKLRVKGMRPAEGHD
jgi:single-stranded-DNA-specific exonuclease